MGNSLRFPLLGCSGNPRFPVHLQLPSAAIDLSTEVMEIDDGTLVENLSVLYTVDGSTCKLSLTSHVDTVGHFKTLNFFFNERVHLDCGQMLFTIERSATGSVPVLSTRATRKYESVTSMKNNLASNAWGGCTITASYMYGQSGNRGGLLVYEWKNSKDDLFIDLIVAHYVALNILTSTSVGFSVVAKVHANNDGKFDVTVEGPELHPASALLYMFDEVNRTGLWKASMCPHCANTRRQLSRMLWQSDSDDSDGVPVPSRRASRQNATAISNNGSLRDGNGNFIENINMYLRRRW